MLEITIRHQQIAITGENIRQETYQPTIEFQVHQYLYIIY